IVDRLPEDVQDATERRGADRDRDRAAGVDDLHAALDAVRRGHGDCAHLVAADFLLDLADDVDRGRLDSAIPTALRPNLQRVVDLRQVAGIELDVEHGSNDLYDAPAI